MEILKVQLYLTGHKQHMLRTHTCYHRMALREDTQTFHLHVITTHEISWLSKGKLTCLIELGTSQGTNLDMFHISNSKATLIYMANDPRVKEDQDYVFKHIKRKAINTCHP